jgi:hypothetical protein
LLAILTNLCGLTYSIYCLVAPGGEAKAISERALNLLSAGIPIVLGVIGYALETDEPEDITGKLNLARHVYSCSMR